MPASETSCSLPTRTILLVEDEESVRQITRYVLEGVGYLVLEAFGPEQAIAILSQYEGSIDLLLTDVVMPTMSGAELAARLKAMRPSLIVMFMSGYARNAGLSQGGFGSPDCYLQKPFSTRMLLSRVAEALSLPPSTREGPAEIRLPI
jgi:two-component system cell cycle sensor histidine kinase/response regulator CckA